MHHSWKTTRPCCMARLSAVVPKAGATAAKSFLLGLVCCIAYSRRNRAGRDAAAGIRADWEACVADADDDIRRRHAELLPRSAEDGLGAGAEVLHGRHQFDGAITRNTYSHEESMLTKRSHTDCAMACHVLIDRCRSRQICGCASLCAPESSDARTLRAGFSSIFSRSASGSIFNLTASSSMAARTRAPCGSLAPGRRRRTRVMKTSYSSVSRFGQAIDELAVKLNMDPLALREKIDEKPARKVERQMILGAHKLAQPQI